jgi:hypothetical protein
MHKRKRGRPRKPGARTPSGQLSRAAGAVPVDRGTREGQRNRTFLVNGSPVELAGSPVGILLAGGHIEARHAAAAWKYAMMRARCFGMARATANWDLIDLGRGGQPLTEDRQKHARRAFERLVALLEPAQKSALDLLVVDGAIPTWFRRAKLRQPLRPADVAERDALLGALEALAEG